MLYFLSCVASDVKGLALLMRNDLTYSFRYANVLA